MKKYFILAAIAITALASCTKDEPANTTEPQKITFEAPVIGSITKSPVYGEMPSTYDTKETFNVYAVWHGESGFDKWETGSKYMDKVTVSHKSTINDDTEGTGAWAPENDYYWPKVGVLSFAAYSPSYAEGTISYGNDGLTITNFPVRSQTSLQYDLMFSERTIGKSASTEGNNPTYDGVDINFKHALSSIKFTAKTQADYSATTTIKVTKISLWGMNSKGTFKENVTDGATYTSNPTWTSHSEPVANTVPYIAYNGSLTLSTTSQDANSNGVILLPQTFNNENAKIRVDYTMKTTEGAEIPQYKEVAIKDLSGEWIYGYRYTYNIVISLDNVYFAPSVEAWKDQDGVGSVAL